MTGRHNDTELHLAAASEDLEAVKEILGEIDAQMTTTLRVGLRFAEGLALKLLREP